MNIIEKTVPEGQAEKRLDCFLRECTEFSRSRISILISEGRCEINGRLEMKPSRILETGDRVTLSVPMAEDPGIVPENIPLEFLYQDADIVVVNKPAGMVVHPAAGNPGGTLVNALLYAVRDLSGIGGEIRPGIVHRLDKDTSGVLVVAKNDRAHQALGEQFSQRSLEKHYRAVVLGSMKEESGRIEAPIGRSQKDRKKMAVVEGGRPSVTEWTRLSSLRGATFLDVHLLTGRTHQIRVHMKSIGHPVLGDQIYAPKAECAVRIPRLMLHAYSIEINHPVTGERMQFTAPLPAEFSTFLEKIKL